MRISKISEIYFKKFTSVLNSAYFQEHFDKFNLKDNATDDLTKYSPPITSKINPRITKTTLIKLILAKIGFEIRITKYVLRFFNLNKC